MINMTPPGGMAAPGPQVAPQAQSQRAAGAAPPGMTPGGMQQPLQHMAPDGSMMPGPAMPGARPAQPMMQSMSPMAQQQAMAQAMRAGAAPQVGAPPNPAGAGGMPVG